MYDFKQFRNCPTRITCNNSTLIDHIFTNAKDNIFHSGIISTAISDHNMIYYTRTMLKTKYNKHEELTFLSLRNYSDDVSKESFDTGTFVSELRKLL